MILAIVFIKSVMTIMLEYLLWRLKYAGKTTHGIGITLKADAGAQPEQEFTSELSWNIENESFVATYGRDGTGTLYVIVSRLSLLG